MRWASQNGNIRSRAANHAQAQNVPHAFPKAASVRSVRLLHRWLPVCSVGLCPQEDITPLYLNVMVHVLALIVPVLFMVALATLYPRCAGRAAFLGEGGIILGSLGSALGAVRALVDLAVPSLYPHDALSGRLLQFLFDVWTPTLFIGLLVVGLASLATRTSRGVGALLLAMGVFGWALRATNSGGIFETRLAHAGLGILPRKRKRELHSRGNALRRGDWVATT